MSGSSMPSLLPPGSPLQALHPLLSEQLSALLSPGASPQLHPAHFAALQKVSKTYERMDRFLEPHGSSIAAAAGSSGSPVAEAGVLQHTPDTRRRTRRNADEKAQAAAASLNETVSSLAQALRCAQRRPSPPPCPTRVEHAPPPRPPGPAGRPSMASWARSSWWTWLAPPAVEEVEAAGAESAEGVQRRAAARAAATRAGRTSL